MSTELERAKGSPWVFTKTSNDVAQIFDTAEYFDIIDTMDFKLPKKCLLTISYSMEIEIPAPAQNGGQALFIICTLDPASANLLLGGVDCHPNGGVPPPAGIHRGVSFGNNFGLNTLRYRGVHSFTWVEKLKTGSHKIVMRAMYNDTLGGQAPQTFTTPKILKRTLVVQAFPI